MSSKSLANRPPCLLVATIAGALGLVGCGPADDEAFFGFDWQLVFVGDRGGAGGRVTCEEAGTATVTIVAENLSTREKRMASFDCRLGRARTAALPEGNYAVTIRLETSTGLVISELAGGTAGIRRFEGTDLGIVVFKIQSFALGWSLCKLGPKTDTAPRTCARPVSCADVDGKTVRLTAQLPDRPALRFSWPCGDGSGTTTAVPTGTYGLQVHLVSSSDAVLSMSEPKTFVVTTSERAVLPLVQFAVE
jgi:hypothetical protein